ncbi:MAG: hypothetical protein LM577_08120 [Thermoproteaceae archaeon]|nr:hypothetical protein [Thermoproteaceae archaeon]
MSGRQQEPGPEGPIFFSVKKGGSYLSWRPYGDFFNFASVCIEVLDGRHFVIAPGNCQEVQRFGRKLYARIRSSLLEDGEYLLVGEVDNGYYFVLRERSNP